MYTCTMYTKRNLIIIIVSYMYSVYYMDSFFLNHLKKNSKQSVGTSSMYSAEVDFKKHKILFFSPRWCYG